MHDSSFPPHRTHSSSRVSTVDALARLSEYLEKSDTDASLHPGALLTENGPITQFAGESTGLVLHNLKRLQAGLKGEHLAADVEPNVDTAADGVTVLPGGADVTGGGDANTNGEMNFDWQDLSEFEQEQEHIEGDIGARTNGVGIVGRDEEKEVLGFRNTSEDKASRKKEKKARHKDRRRAREESKKVNGVVG